MKKVLALLLAVRLLTLPACTGNSNQQEIGTTTIPPIIQEYPGDTGIAIDGATVFIPNDVFTQSASENGLGGKLYIITGEVTKCVTSGTTPYFVVSTKRGNVMIGDASALSAAQGDNIKIDLDRLSVFFPMPEVGETVRVTAEYQGMSGTHNLPFFLYGSSDYLTNALMLSASTVDDTTTPADVPTSDTPATTPVETQPAATNPPATDPPATTAATEALKPTESSATVGEKNALKSAKQYLQIMPFSHDGLIGQLEYEGYTTSEATYAADNCGADWNAQALKSAKKYLDVSAFSYSGLLRQLEYEKYTTAQATYGADNCGADWYEQAAKSAAHYLSIMSFSRDGLISQLEYEGFTHDQAVHGVEANGL